jgi:integrase
VEAHAELIVHANAVLPGAIARERFKPIARWNPKVVESPRLVRVHDLKHTLGRRLRAAGVSFEDRQDLLGHRSGRITTHYSAAELSKLLESANRVCESDRRQPELVVLRRLSVA